MYIYIYLYIYIIYIYVYIYIFIYICMYIYAARKVLICEFVSGYVNKYSKMLLINLLSGLKKLTRH